MVTLNLWLLKGKFSAIHQISCRPTYVASDLLLNKIKVLDKSLAI